MDRVKAYAVLVVAFVVIFSLYCILSRLWAVYGGTSNGLVRFEYPVLLLFGALFFVPAGGAVRPNIIAALAASLPLIAAYVAFDVHYSYLHRALRLSDIQDARTLWDFQPALPFGLICVAALVFLPAIRLFVKGMRGRQRAMRHIVSGLAFRAVLTAMSFWLVFASGITYPYLEKDLRFRATSDARNIKKHGRFASVIYYSGRSRAAAAKLAAVSIRNTRDPLAVAVGRKRNVHIVVLESFMDPRYVADIAFSGPGTPLYEEMPRLLPDSYFNVAVSPVYGGHTAQAEFEILCGVPALGRVESVDFNVFSGTPVKSLVTTLKA